VGRLGQGHVASNEHFADALLGAILGAAATLILSYIAWRQLPTLAKIARAAREGHEAAGVGDDNDQGNDAGGTSRQTLVWSR